ncbi:TPA: PfkB family carbohydrate kinase, partial [Klebsiella pneumoniae]
MIHTLTLNTAIDMNIFCDPLQPAAVNRTRQTEYCPNGKGVNVSLVLHHYQQPTHVMGIFGGFTGRYIVEELRKQHINVTPAWVAEPTRINIFINDGSDEYKLVNPGARI